MLPCLCRWASRRATRDAASKQTPSRPSAFEDSWEEAETSYSPATMKSLEVVDEEVLNYDLLEALVVHIVQTEAVLGQGALLKVRFTVSATT